MEKISLRCEILSPVHIGSGDEIDPLHYIIKHERLYRLSFTGYIEQMNDSERAEFEDLINKRDLIGLRKYISDHIDTDKDFIYSTGVTPKIGSLYQSKISDIQNQLLISPFIREEGTAKPLIPGSSIKGAIRTAIINGFAQKSNLPKPKDSKEEYKFESKVLGYKDAKNDPFRGIKIRDKTLQDDSTIIRDVKNVSKKSGGKLQSNNIQMFCEVSHSSITGNSIYFDTQVLIDKRLYSTNFLSKSFTMEGIINSCSEFYRDKMEYEHKKFYKNSEVELCSTQLLDTAIGKDAFLLRAGRYSGVESVTLDNYRNPKPSGNKHIWGTTRNLAEGIYPMGWIKVTII